MNRAQRRQGRKKEKGKPAAVSQPTLQRIFSDALQHQQAGRLEEAEKLHRQILAVDGRHDDSLHLLGIIAYRQNRYDDAVDLISQAIRSREDVPAYHTNLGAALRSQGKLAEAIEQYERALALDPDQAEGHNNLGNVLMLQGHLAEAEARFARALALNPAYGEASYNLGLVLERQGRFEEARRCYERAQALKPGYADALYNRAVALQRLGRIEEAAVLYKRTLALDPAYASAYGNWASLLLHQGKFLEAIAPARKALELRDTPETRSMLAECIKRAEFSPTDDGDIRELMSRALSEVWCPPAEMAPAAIRMIKRRLEIARCIGRTALSAAELNHLAEDPLVLCLLRRAPICDPQLELLFTVCRAALLAAVPHDASSAEMTGPILDLACALAEQCFVNEYVFACSIDEARLVAELETRILAHAPAPLTCLVMLSAYRPLVSLQGAERLAEQAWPEPAGSLLEIQLREPLEERRSSTEIERLTPVRNEVSTRVQEQYEQNPYPRWLKLPAGTPAQSIEELVANNHPRASLRPMGPRRPDILIAGCGTGQQSIATAQIFPTADILAIDLSRASLAYAGRKTRELVLRNIHYAQADILELRNIGRQFDLIDSSGVLHHLGEPVAGLDILVSLLRPNGVLKLAFYSEIARRPIVEVRRHIAEQGYAATADDIRRCRQDLLALPDDDVRKKVLTIIDFYSMSECRDLLFPAQEHCLTLPVIAEWLDRFGLRFIAFSVPPEIEQAFDRRFPDQAARADLGSWHRFEQENPNAFIGMYRFWVQKSE